MSILQTRLKKKSNRYKESRRDTLTTANLSISPRYYRPIKTSNLSNLTTENFSYSPYNSGVKNHLSLRNGTFRHRNVLKTILKNSRRRKRSKKPLKIVKLEMTLKTPQKAPFLALQNFQGDETSSSTSLLNTENGNKYYRSNPIYQELIPKKQKSKQFNFMNFSEKENMNVTNLRNFQQFCVRESETNVKEELINSNPFTTYFESNQSEASNPQMYLSMINQVKKP